MDKAPIEIGKRVILSEPSLAGGRYCPDRNRENSNSIGVTPSWRGGITPIEIVKTADISD